MVERVVLPELGRALAFAADCRIEQVISRYEKQAVGLSFSPALTTPAHGVTSLPIKQALDDSLLRVTSTDDGDGAGRLAAWGCGDYRYVGGGRNVAWSGDVFTAHAGADMQLGSTVLAGVSVSRSMGSFDYDAGNISGDYELRMTGVHPYLAWSVSSLKVWATVGHGRGELRFVDNVRPTTLNSSMVGVSGRLLAREGTRVQVAGEWAMARMDVADVESGTANMRRVRLRLEASHMHVLSSGQSITPWGELGLRHDGGDGETGSGLEVGGGLRYQHPAGLIAEGRARRLAMHEGTIREWGVGVLLRFDPGMVGRGLSVSLAPSWGETVSGVQHVWEHGATDLVPQDVLGMRMDTRVGYGLRVFRGRVVLSPEMSLARGMVHGYRWSFVAMMHGTIQF